jgi:IS30 family transposase
VRCPATGKATCCWARPRPASPPWWSATSRFTLLIKLNSIKSEPVIAALTQHVVTLPEQLRRSLTWDQGKEMAQHVRFTIDTSVQIYFCDPKSPWQRGSNENTNGLLRQYFPKRVTDLRVYSQPTSTLLPPN